MKKIFHSLSLKKFLCLFFFLNLGVFATQDADNDDLFTREKILEILARETILYYDDGKTQFGSLFGTEHRLYVTIDRVPQVLKDAIISAEDESFYTNIGIDFKGIVRAGINNLLHGTRQGASTITQQTVKNLYGRSKTNLATKFQEMINAFKLEKRFSKDEILEFYLNQFHVTANGRGVGIAAKYYFNKDVEDLNLVEAAFIAGSVKGPDKYNPFTKATVENQDQARENAMIRKNYVLDRMFRADKITEEQYNAARNIPVPFNQGKFQFNELAISQIVKRQLARPEILKALDIENLDEIANKGYRITTTLNHPIQKSAQYGLRQNLSRIQMALHDFSLESQNQYQNIQKPEPYEFYTAKVIDKDPTYRAESITVKFSAKTCAVNTSGIRRVALMLDQGRYFGIDRSTEKLLSLIQPGQYVLVSLKNISPNSDLICDLETRPTVQGGAIAIDKGEIISLVGGFSTNEYNRAIFAQRQPGSTFKVPVYYAGMQLGWSALDLIPNIRDVFVWQKQFYYPRPDHPPVSLETTPVGAGAKSENLASIWLLRHLTDKLTYAQYEDLLEFLNIASQNVSMNGNALQIIANKFNVSANDEANIREGILEKVKNDLLSDLSVMNDPNLKIFSYTLHYGNGFERQSQIVEKTFPAGNRIAKREKDIRLNALKNNLIRWNRVSQNANQALSDVKNLSPHETAFGTFALSSNKRHLFYISNDNWKPELASPLVEPVEYQYLSSSEVHSLFVNQPKLFTADNVYIDAVVPLSMIESINNNLEDMYQNVQTLPPLEKLYWNADFRYSLGMYYTSSMLRGMGVQTAFDWVPSLPLGSNPITLAELAMIYQTFLTGKTYQFYNDRTGNQLAIIKRIEDANGNLLWEYQSRESQYVDPLYSTPTLNILRSVVTAGTGYPLNWDVVLRSQDPTIDRQLSALKIRVPNFGKTGTTNDFTNGTYVGFMPYPAERGTPLSAENAITIATYIGNDNNAPMRRGGYKVYGGGAIPAWEEIALSIVKNKKFTEKIDWKNNAVMAEHLLPFDYGPNAVELMVPLNSGLSISRLSAVNDDDELVEKNVYLNDYSENGQRFLKLSLNGQVSDHIFIPKRKISFYRKDNQTLLETGRNAAFHPPEFPENEED